MYFGDNDDNIRQTINYEENVESITDAHYERISEIEAETVVNNLDSVNTYNTTLNNFNEVNDSHKRNDIGVMHSLESREKANYNFSTDFRFDAMHILETLRTLTDNEQHCPEIMPYPAQVVDRALELVHIQEGKIERTIEMEKQNTDADNNKFTIHLSLLPSNIMRLEMERINFFICELLRCRLRKIERLCTSIYFEGHNEENDTSSTINSLINVEIPQRCNLSTREQLIADRLAIAIQRAVVRNGLHNLPTNLQYITPHLPEAEGVEILPTPNLYTYVFAVALEELGTVSLMEGVQQNIHVGEMFLLPYHSLREKIIDGKVRLLEESLIEYYTRSKFFAVEQIITEYITRLDHQIVYHSFLRKMLTNCYFIFLS